MNILSSAKRAFRCGIAPCAGRSVWSHASEWHDQKTWNVIRIHFVYISIVIFRDVLIRNYSHSASSQLNGAALLTAEWILLDIAQTTKDKQLSLLLELCRLFASHCNTPHRLYYAQISIIICNCSFYANGGVLINGAIFCIGAALQASSMYVRVFSCDSRWQIQFEMRHDVEFPRVSVCEIQVRSLEGVSTAWPLLRQRRTEVSDPSSFLSVRAWSAFHRWRGRMERHSTFSASLLLLTLKRHTSYKCARELARQAQVGLEEQNY